MGTLVSCWKCHKGFDGDDTAPSGTCPACFEAWVRTERVEPGEEHESNEHDTHAPRVQRPGPVIPGGSGLPGRSPVLGVLGAQLLALPFAIAGALIGARRGWIEGQRTLRRLWSLVAHAPTVRTDEQARESES